MATATATTRGAIGRRRNRRVNKDVVGLAGSTLDFESNGWTMTDGTMVRVAGSGTSWVLWIFVLLETRVESLEVTSPTTEERAPKRMKEIEIFMVEMLCGKCF